MKRYTLNWFRIVLVAIAVICGTGLLYSHVFADSEREVNVTTTQATTASAPLHESAGGGNHTLYVAKDTAKLYDDAESKASTGRLEAGDLFYFDSNNVKHRDERLSQYPTDTVRKYHMQPVTSYSAGEERQRYYTARISEHQTDDTADAGNAIYTEGKFLSDSYTTLTNHIYLSLKHYAGCDFTERCETDNFYYDNAGYYGTTLKHDAMAYDKNGDELGTLDAGTQVYTTFDYEASTGAENKDLIRFVAYRDAGEDESTFGTVYVELFTNDNEMTIATQK